MGKDRVLDYSKQEGDMAKANCEEFVNATTSRSDNVTASATISPFPDRNLLPQIVVQIGKYLDYLKF